MAELVDALVSGTSGSNPVEVQVLSWATVFIFLNYLLYLSYLLLNSRKKLKKLSLSRRTLSVERDSIVLILDERCDLDVFRLGIIFPAAKFQNFARGLNDLPNMKF